MRHISVVCFLWGSALCMLGLPLVNAQIDDDEVSNDDAYEVEQDLDDDSEQSEVSGEVAAGPVAPEGFTDVTVSSENRNTVGKQKNGPAASAGPGTISMASSLNRFGKRHDSSATAVKPTSDNTAKGAKASQAETDAQNAQVAANTAKAAAKVANKVAVHSVHITEHAKSALKDAHDALHKARVQTAGLSDGQKQSLKAAEVKLREATKNAEYGQVKNAKYVKADVDNKALQKMERKMDKLKEEKEGDELEAMRKDLKELRKQLKEKEGDKAEDDATLKELQEELEKMQAAEKKEDSKDKKHHDEMKAEIERLRAQIKSMEDNKGSVSYSIPEKDKEKETSSPPKRHKEVQEEKVRRYDVKMEPLSASKEKAKKSPVERSVSPIEEKGIDIDTAMPYGDLEPFGREDTAQELTESSIKESDGMVDQLERAEVAEEKRSVFRALTRLRGAAITSFDGVARSQTGNIDEYNKIHKWRKTHPMHHLADEESDVTKWAFPDNAD